MREVPLAASDHPDRTRWNARYGGSATVSFHAHPLAAQALSLPAPDGPVLDLACGPSGAGLAAAAAGRQVTAVDISDVALGLLAREARRRRLRELITLVHADLGEWRPEPERYALVLCTGYWERAIFGPAAEAVAPGGLLGWEAYTVEARHVRPALTAAWCLDPGEPASLLPADFTVLDQQELPDPDRGAKRRLLAGRRDRPPG
jgi:SAM-dependent methyltransferase